MKVVVVLVEPEKAGNLGLVGRLCENFEVDELRLVNPKIPENELWVADMFASRAADRVRGAEVFESLREALEDVDYSVATSAIYRNRGPNIARRAINLDELGRIISRGEIGTLALIFGRESSGLTREEIEMSDLLLTIETSEHYRTLNLACSVAIVLYEVYKALKAKSVRKLARREIRNRMISYFKEVTVALLKDDSRIERAVKAFSNVINRGTPDHREATLIIGVLRLAAERLKAG